MATPQPSSRCALLCSISCKPINQSINSVYPSVVPYCNAKDNSSGVKEIWVSSSPGDGDFAVKLRDVKGNPSGFGFPARRERTPGVASRGRRLWTLYH